MTLGYIHYFRAIAIVFIVGGHCIDAFVWSGSRVEEILRIVISYDGTVFFVFIAGYLFQHLSEKFEFKLYYSRKLKNVVFPYLITSIPAIALSVTVINQHDVVWPGFYDTSVWRQVINFYLTGFHLAPFWFVPTIVLFFLCAPILLWADRHRDIYLLLPIFILLSCVTTRGFPLENFIHFFSAYLLGMFCSNRKQTINQLISHQASIQILFIVVIALSFLIFRNDTSETSPETYLQKLVMCLLILGVLVRFCASEKIPTYIGLLADYSFGIYFTHGYIISVGKILFERMNGALLTGTMAIYVFTCAAVVIACSVCIWLTKRKFPFYSRQLIGS